MDSLIALLCQINQVELLKLVMKSLEVMKKQTVARAILIVSYAVYHLPVSGLDKLTDRFPLVSEWTAQLSKLLKDKKTPADMFDIALEGISVVWLRYPETLLQSATPIFDMIVSSMNSAKIQSTTKACILQTLTRFLKDSS